MAIELPCPGCGRTLRVGDEHAGKQARCPECQTITTVPAVGGQGGALGAPFHSELPSSGELSQPQAFAGIDPPAQPSTQPSAGSSGGMWQMKTPEGQIYGPVSRSDLEGWLRDGRISHDCQLLQQGSMQWQWASTVFPSVGGPQRTSSSGNPFATSSDESRERGMGGAINTQRTAVGRSHYQSPHRGGLVLALGILGITMCSVFTAIPAWVMGAHDLAEMKAGRMDNEGYGITQAGMVLGIVSVVLGVLSMLFVCCGGIAGGM